MNRRLALIPAAALALTLVACSSDTNDNPVTTEIVTVTEEAPQASSAAASAPSTEDKDEAATATTDAALAAAQDALKANADGIITEIDRKGDSYEIDMIVGDEHLELMVDAKGQVMETKRERETDLDDLNEARNATVSAEEAIREALSQHSDGMLDSISLDEEDGSLRWEIDLDDAQGNDLAELKIPAA